MDGAVSVCSRRRELFVSNLPFASPSPNPPSFYQPLNPVDVHTGRTDVHKKRLVKDAFAPTLPLPSATTEQTRAAPARRLEPW